MVPETLHAPILQQAVVLRDTQAARAFSGYFRTQEARSIIQSYGYETP
jgi:molybdate transport system substrate-binding protein